MKANFIPRRTKALQLSRNSDEISIVCVSKLSNPSKIEVGAETGNIEAGIKLASISIYFVAFYLGQ